MKLPDLRSVPATVADAASAVGVLARAGVIGPFLPRPGLAPLVARAPFKTPNMGSAVAVHAAVTPSKTALIDDAGAVTWRELNQRTRRLANALLGVAAEGDRVAFMLRNGREHVECYAACGLAGLAAVPVNTWSPAAEIAHIVSTQRPKVFIADEEFAEALRGVDVPVWWVGPDGDYEDVLAASAQRVPPVRGGGRIVTHTSGTTGRPKGAERDVGNANLNLLVGFLEKVPLHRNDVFLIGPPLFHQLGQAMVALGLVLGTPLILPRRFEPEDFLRVAIERQASAAVVLPVMLKRIVDLPADVPSPRLRVAVVSGSAFPTALRERAERRLGRVFYDLYGSTEVGWATIGTPQDQERRPGSVGRSGRGTRVLIVDDDGNILPPGKVGHIHVAGLFAFEGYTGIEHDKRVVEDALDIGDLGYLDEEGYLFVTGRGDEMIVSGGENIFPSEVEGVLERHPDLLDSAVIGVEDEQYGEVLHAFVVLREGVQLDAAAIVEFVRGHLARYKAPKHVSVIDELPRNAAGKVLKTELRKSLPDR